jgi:UDP-GlcNAc:undecaprenyl-phosphate/decaprenyl-phosphate GlcNAc-1-phosphate transferase
MDVRFSWFVLALIALVATLSVIEMVRVCAVRLQAVDIPGGRRSHRSPTARLGGLGIFWGFAVALALATYGPELWGLPVSASGMGLVGMLIGAGALVCVGLADDVYGLAATLKLCVQIVAALCLYGFGWRVESLGIPGVGHVSVGAFSLPLTVAWVVFVTNALNLIDGLDGLAGGLALVAALAASWMLAATGSASFLVAAALAGALAGFLWFNLYPALIFMGDTGSLFVGFVLSAITLRASQLASLEAFPLVPVLLLAVPLLDTLDAIARRTLAAAAHAATPVAFLRDVRARVFAPDGMHVHHRLVKSGLTARRAVATLWLVAAGFAAAACLVVRAPLAGLGLAAVLAVFVVRRFAALDARLALGSRAQVLPVFVPMAESRELELAMAPHEGSHARLEPALTREALDVDEVVETATQAA